MPEKVPELVAATHKQPAAELGSPESARDTGHIDQALVERAVCELNHIYTTKALQTACLIGEYVIDRFFGGDVEASRRDSCEHASFRALTKREDLRFSSTYLWTAVAVVGQLRELPEELAQCLPLSHHRLLLPVKDASVKVALARIAVKQSLSKRDLEREIGRLVGSQARAAKREMNVPVIKALSHLIEASEEFVQAATAEDNGLRRSAGGEAHSLLQRLEVDLDAVHCLMEMLRSRLQIGTVPQAGVSPGKQVRRIEREH